MGFRLEGPKLEHRDGYNIVSDGIVTGAVQVPGSGQPILLLADHQTTGGYPKIATVISADLPVVGRRRPGSPIRFAAVDVAEAETIRRRQEATLQRLARQLQPVAESGDIDLASLYSGNLISGVVSARD
jgi:allophanate hydrolase subunit 2